MIDAWTDSLVFTPAFTLVLVTLAILGAVGLVLAYKCKGPDRLALVTDANRALDMPDGPYMMGPLDGG